MGSTSHLSSGTKYEVFLSFRGPDTRATFTDSLYHTLRDKGIRVFIDKQGIDVGEEIGPEIFQAIDDSKICILVFSRGYASSSWCLRELEHMMERRKTNEVEVMPIFYDVEPSDVKLETRVYVDALTLHKEKRGAEIVQRWAEALKEVTGIKGWDTKNIGHGELAHLIARKVLVKLKVSCVHISDHLVGMDESTNEVVDLLNVESKDVRLIGIWGMGGIGKTTLAKVVFNKLSTNFDGCSFISDIREASQSSGLSNVQGQLVSDIIGDVGVKISSVDHGKNMIQDRFCRKKVFIVLDDVDHASQLMALAAKKEWFGSGSRIVVTTRDRSVFCKFQDQFDHCLIYEVEELNNVTALQLFSMHAFRSNSPPNAYLSLSEKFIAKTGGLPLAIEVIGSFLYGKKEEAVWQETLKKMGHCQRKDVKEKLMLSYHALDHMQQQIFLDIACFLVGLDKSYPYYMWDDSGFFPNEGIDVLLLMSLVKIGEMGRLWMHDQLKDLGRSIVHEESLKDPTKGSRVWWEGPRGWGDPQEGLDIVQQKKGTGTVAAYYQQSQTLSSEDFIKMPNIRFLKMSAKTLSGDFEDLFSELRWLSWYFAPIEMQATNFCLKNLVILELRLSTIDEHWGGWTQLKVATRLKVLDLSNCEMLKETPELSTFLSLEILILNGCTALTKLSNSIGMLKYLAELDVSHTSIAELPNTIVNLKSLKVLKMNHSYIQKLPEAIWMMEKLEEIDGEDCRSLEMIPSDIVRLPSLKILKLTRTCVENVPKLPQSLVATRLKVLNLSHCRMLIETHELSAFVSLEILILNGCGMLTKLSNSIGMLKYLVELDVSYTSIAELPNTIVNLKTLKVLKMNHSPMQKLPETIGMMEELEEIYGERCWRLEMIPSDIVRLPSLKILKLTETLLVNIPKLPQSLVGLHLSSIVSKNNREITDLVSSRNREFRFPPSYPPTFRGCPPEYINPCCKLELPIITSISSYLGCFHHLGELELKNCDNVRFVGQLPSDLRKFTVDNCRLLEVVDLSDLSNYKNLTDLEVWDCSGLVEIRGLDRLESLQSLCVECCSPLLRLPDLSTWKELEYWDVDALATNSARGKQVARSDDLPL